MGGAVKIDPLWMIYGAIVGWPLGQLVALGLLKLGDWWKARKHRAWLKANPPGPPLQIGKLLQGVLTGGSWRFRRQRRDQA